MTNSSPWKDLPFVIGKLGKPFISIRVIYTEGKSINIPSRYIPGIRPSLQSTSSDFLTQRGEAGFVNALPGWNRTLQMSSDVSCR